MNQQHTIAILGFNHHDITMEVLHRVIKRNPGCKILFFDNGSTPPFKELLPKSVEYIRKEQNIYVNPAWNEIFDKVETKYLTLLNNDCLPIRRNYFDHAIQDMEENNLSITSCKTIDISSLSKWRILFYRLVDKALSPLDLNPVETARRQGWLMTINLDHYQQCTHKIPGDLKVWYGDDWIAYQLFKNGFKGATYRNALAIHVQSTSSGSRHIKDIIAKDAKAVVKYDIDYKVSVLANKRLKWFR